MAEREIQCEECGGQVPRDARTLGLCPRCLMARVIDVRRNVRQQMDRLGETGEITVQELRELFPQLQVERLIARGGMGWVYKAFDRQRNRPVALKILPMGEGQDVDLLGRFISEARILSRLEHPNIVGAYESGQAGECLYLMMELVPGPSLREILSSGPLGAEEAVAVTMQICNALVYAHERGIVHRDIKPENILLHGGEIPAGPGLKDFFARGGRARLVDFGLARPTKGAEHRSAETAPDRYVGTADYVAPETRYRQKAPGAPADIYSLGVVLYEMLVGKLPMGHFALPSKAADAPRRLDRIVLKCLADDSSDRYASAAELKEALERSRKSRAMGVTAWAMASVLCGLCIAASAIFYWPRGGKENVATTVIARTPAVLAKVPSAMPVAMVQPVAATVARAAPVAVVQPATVKLVKQSVVAAAKIGPGGAVTTRPVLSNAAPVVARKMTPTTMPVANAAPAPTLQPTPFAGIPWWDQSYSTTMPAMVPQPIFVRRMPIIDPPPFQMEFAHPNNDDFQRRRFMLIHEPFPGRPSPQFLIDQFGQDRVIEVRVEGVAEAEARKAIIAQLQQATGKANFFASSSASEMQVYLGPYADVADLAGKIQFGTVTDVDKGRRLIDVTVKPAGTQPSKGS